MPTHRGVRLAVRVGIAALELMIPVAHIDMLMAKDNPANEANKIPFRFNFFLFLILE